MELLNFKLDIKSSPQQCYLESKLDQEQFVIQGNDDKETDAWKKQIYDTLFTYEENRDEILKKEIDGVKHDLNDMWNMYIESEQSTYNKQSVEVSNYFQLMKKISWIFIFLCYSI